MPRPLPIFSESDYLIQVVDIDSNTEWQTVQIQISWLLQPTDLDLHCLQRQDISGFSRTRVKSVLLPKLGQLFKERICSQMEQLVSLKKSPHEKGWKMLGALVLLQMFSQCTCIMCVMSDTAMRNNYM